MEPSLAVFLFFFNSTLLRLQTSFLAAAQSSGFWRAVSRSCTSPDNSTDSRSRQALGQECRSVGYWVSHYCNALVIDTKKQKKPDKISTHNIFLNVGIYISVWLMPSNSYATVTHTHITFFYMFFYICSCVINLWTVVTRELAIKLSIKTRSKKLNALMPKRV